VIARYKHSSLFGLIIMVNNPKYKDLNPATVKLQ
jgi:hypothetical protein